jgi:TPP-dependent pyruvate/acetoin dehydrogenase alpha subunit
VTVPERPRDRLGDEELLALYRGLERVRQFEDEVYRLFLEGLIQGTTHLCRGQEAVPVGVSAALEERDYVTMTYRGHGQAIARGMPLASAFAELMGRRDGCCKGKGGSMHLTDFHRNLIGSFAIVGAGLPVAVGAALSARYQGEDRVSVTFFGDGATNIGAFHEALNLAVVTKAPVIFVCENNLYGEFTRIDETTPYEDLARRAEAYAMPASTVDGNDVLAVYDAATEAVLRARSGGGPTFLECKTYRHHGHSRTDPATYRPKEEVEAWLKLDPLPAFRNWLERERGVSAATLDAIQREVAKEIEEASAQAKESPWPELTELVTDVYAHEAGGV